MDEKRQPQPDKKEDKKDNKFVISPEIERYMQILRKDPKSPVFAALSEAYRKGSLLDEAITTAIDGLKYNPNYISGRVALGRAYYDKGEFDKAVEELKKVIKTTPDNIISHKLIADIYIKQSNVPAALQELKTTLFLSPDDKEAKTLMGSLSKPVPGQEGKQEAAEPAKQEPIKHEPAVQEIPKQAIKEAEPVPQETVTGALKKEPEKPAEKEGQTTAELQGQKGETSAEIPGPVKQPEEPVPQAEPEEWKQEEAPAAGTASAAVSVEGELETELSQPMPEAKIEEIKTQQPAEEPFQATQTAETAEAHVMSGAKEEVKTEELEAVFEELSGKAETPQEQGLAAQEHVMTEPIRSEMGPAPSRMHPEEPEPAPLELISEPVQQPAEQDEQQPLEGQGEEIQTVTMADLYVKQGHLDKAYQIYKKILLKNSDNSIIRAKLVKVKKLIESKQQDELDKSKLEALKEQEPKPSRPEQSDAIKENMKRLNAWLEKIKKGG